MLCQKTREQCANVTSQSLSSNRNDCEGLSLETLIMFSFSDNAALLYTGLNLSIFNSNNRIKTFLFIDLIVRQLWKLYQRRHRPEV